MGRRLPVYGLDIETDTTIDGTNPATSRVLTVALSLPGFDELFVGFEHELLTELDGRLAELEPGVLATWNGAAFDLPFLADRARLWGIELGLELRLDRSIRLQHAPLPGHLGAYRAAWHHHCHLDAYHVYRDDAPDLSIEAQHAHARSDARLARVLTERRWASASRFVDRLPARHDVA